MTTIKCVSARCCEEIIVGRATNDAIEVTKRITNTCTRRHSNRAA